VIVELVAHSGEARAAQISGGAIVANMASRASCDYAPKSRNDRHIVFHEIAPPFTKSYRSNSSEELDQPTL
jgi:hypothetical protein